MVIWRLHPAKIYVFQQQAFFVDCPVCFTFVLIVRWSLMVNSVCCSDSMKDLDVEISATPIDGSGNAHIDLKVCFLNVFASCPIDAYSVDRINDVLPKWNWPKTNGLDASDQQ